MVATGIPLLLRLLDRGKDGTRFKRPAVVVGVVKFSVLALAVGFFLLVEKRFRFFFVVNPRLVISSGRHKKRKFKEKSLLSIEDYVLYSKGIRSNYVKGDFFLNLNN